MESLADTHIEAVILAGGFGSRLQSVVSDVPKPMADIAGTPFLVYLLRYLYHYGIRRTVLSVGYKYEAIQSYLGDRFNDMQLIYAIEDTPLGTGGGIVNALQKTESHTLLICNGDTYYQVDLPLLHAFHNEHQGMLTLALKPMHHITRYGTVTVEENRITQFRERQEIPSGLINGGIYFIEKNRFLSRVSDMRLSLPFSFEKDFLETLTPDLIYGYVDNGFFIDIGIPDDYQSAQQSLSIISHKYL